MTTPFLPHPQPRVTLSQRGRQRLPQWLDRHQESESGAIMYTALIMGIGAGLGAIVFRRLIANFQSLTYAGLGGLMAGIVPYHLLIIPAVSCLILDPLINFMPVQPKDMAFQKRWKPSLYAVGASLLVWPLSNHWHQPLHCGVNAKKP